MKTLAQVRDWHKQVAAVNAIHLKGLPVMRLHGMMADAIEAQIAEREAGVFDKPAIVYAAEFCANVYESGFSLLSLHKSRAAAQSVITKKSEKETKAELHLFGSVEFKMWKVRIRKIKVRS